MKKRTIAERNEWFKKLSMPNKRVAIARDAFEQILLDRYIAVPGEYLVVNVPNTMVGRPVNLKRLLNMKILSCDVCAKGALVASIARLNNPIMEEDYYGGQINMDGNPTMKILTKYFEEEDADNMENAFESEGHGYLSALAGPDDDLAQWRLLRILSNIILNKGMTFTDYDDKTEKMFEKLTKELSPKIKKTGTENVHA